MKALVFRHIDAFTREPFTGNPAAVVTSAGGIDEAQMQRIAREMNLSETAFVLPPTSSAADLRIRWFTPTSEVRLCGHATIASFHAMAEEGLHGMKKNGTYSFRLETASGILPVEVRKDDRETLVKFGLPVPKFRRMAELKAEFFAALGITPDAYDKRLHPVGWGSAYLPVKRLSTLYELEPNFEEIKSVLQRKRLEGLCVFTVETIEAASHFHSRYFAPNVGINEDPVTGSANGPLAVYLIENDLVPKTDGVLELVGEQGDIIGRRGRVRVSVTVSGGGVQSVAIIGSAVTLFEGTLRL